jgi:uncharacterized protein YcbK (DUF882 family)
MEPMTYTTAAEAMALIRQGEFALLRRCKISLNFTWGEMLTKRTDRQIKLYFKLEHAENLVKLAAKMEKGRSDLGGRSWELTSCWRDRGTQVRLMKEGTGASPDTSLHPQGKAADIKVKGLTSTTVYRMLDPLWLGGLGDGSDLGFTHVDDRGYNARFDYN